MNTTTAIVPANRAAVPDFPPAHDYQDLVRDFLAGRGANTRRAYARDLEDFRAFAGARDVDSAVRLLLAGGAGNANALALRYRNHLSEARGLAPSTVGRRLAALRSVTRLARTLGLVPWAIEVRGPRPDPVRDTAGPGILGVRAMLAAVTGDSPKARRDRALLRVLHDLGLRRAEAASLALEHLDGDRLHVLRKGKSRRAPVTLPPQTRAAIDEWTSARGDGPGPLFVALDNRSRGRAMTVDGIYHVVKTVGKRAGLGNVAPHMLRHSSVTTGLDLSGGDVRAVARFADHANIQTTTRYDDNRQDLAGRIAKLVASAV